jgi:threonine dehydratase
MLYREGGLVAEPSSAVVAAALMTGAVAPDDRGTTVAIITGGNIDDQLLDEILSEEGT